MGEEKTLIRPRSECIEVGSVLHERDSIYFGGRVLSMLGPKEGFVYNTEVCGVLLKCGVLEGAIFFKGSPPRGP